MLQEIALLVFIIVVVLTPDILFGIVAMSSRRVSPDLGEVAMRYAAASRSLSASRLALDAGESATSELQDAASRMEELGAALQRAMRKEDDEDDD